MYYMICNKISKYVSYTKYANFGSCAHIYLQALLLQVLEFVGINHSLAIYKTSYYILMLRISIIFYAEMPKIFSSLATLARINEILADDVLDIYSKTFVYLNDILGFLFLCKYLQ